MLPEFLYESVYDDKHRTIGINVGAGRRERILQQGLREPMLCEACESRFSVLEDYAARKLRQLPDLSRFRPGHVEFVGAINYNTFKLFQMSLLWRMGASVLSL